MKGIWVLVLLLLVSVGLNAGLAWRLGHQGPPAPGMPGPAPGWDRPGPPGPEGDEPAPGGQRARAMMQDRLDRLAKALDLSPEQQAAIRQVHESSGPMFFANRSAIARLRREIRDLTLAGDVDRTAVLERQQQVSRLQAQLDSLVVETMLAEVKVLTPDQRERYRTLVPLGEPGHRRGGRGRGAH